MSAKSSPTRAAVLGTTMYDFAPQEQLPERSRMLQPHETPQPGDYHQIHHSYFLVLGPMYEAPTVEECPCIYWRAERAETLTPVEG